MAVEETNISHRIMMDVAKSGARLWKNVRGGFYPITAIKPLIAAIMARKWNLVGSLIRSMHPIMAGLLVPGSSDLIGFRSIIITPDMVGSTVAIFCAVEVKTDTGRASKEQLSFIDFISKSGGYAGIARSPEDARKILEISG